MKRERNERVESGRALLRFAQPDQVVDAIFERLDVPVEHRGVAGDALAVQLLVNRQPVIALETLFGQIFARVSSAKNLGRAAVDVVEPGFAKRSDDLRKRQPVTLGHILDLGRGEERELHVRQALP